MFATRNNSCSGCYLNLTGYNLAIGEINYVEDLHFANIQPFQEYVLTGPSQLFFY